MAYHASHRNRVDGARQPHRSINKHSRLTTRRTRTVLQCLLLFALVWIDTTEGRRHKRPETCSKPDNGRSTSFLWRIAAEPPSYFFGTIHVPYSRVWDYVPENVKRAFDASDAVFFELDLTDPNTISALTSCQLLPAGQSLGQVLPPDLYARLKRHLDYVKAVMPSWMSPDQRGRGLYADYLFSAITGNWERKRPIWVMLMVNSLTESDIKSRGIPVLDLYLAQEAERRNKRMGAVERVEEQCVPLNGLNYSQVVFALNQTLHHQESLRAGDHSAPYTTDDLIKHYNCGDLNAVIFSHDTAQVPSMTNVTLAPYEQVMAKKIDEYFRQELIFKRNRRMGQRVLELLAAHPDKSFFFAFGAGHFLGNYTVLDVVQSGGYTVEQLTSDHKILRHRKKQSKPRPSLVPEPSSLRDFSTHLKSNTLDSQDEEFSQNVLDTQTVTRVATNTTRTHPHDSLKKTTFRPPTLLRTSPNLVAAAAAAAREATNQDLAGKYRNFNDLWVRLENGGHSYIRNLQPSEPSSTRMEDSLRVWYGLRPNRATSDSLCQALWVPLFVSMLFSLTRA
ncbi:metalloprotease TIKI1-like [Daphnia pulex]|uniref:metalloprotease TIKI1-like n=1 Tax=Daphnia pulex TaxID=6669 RepID=UPI001EDE1AA4|nr:metalloprotease TIKI1-like [Daphnia pulex]XP_046646613.1 metalloprotease TIKI1-like [Daphnia pulicaria]